MPAPAVYGALLEDAAALFAAIMEHPGTILLVRGQDLLVALSNLLLSRICSTRKASMFDWHAMYVEQSYNVFSVWTWVNGAKSAHTLHLWPGGE